MADNDPLLPKINTSPTSVLIPRWRLLSCSAAAAAASSPSAAAASSTLSPLPEHDQLPDDLPLPSPSSSSLKDRLIFGPSDDTLNLSNLFSPPQSPLTCTPSSNFKFECDAEDPSPVAAVRTAEAAPYLMKYNLHRSRTAPAMSAMPAPTDHHDDHSPDTGVPRRPAVVRQAVVYLAGYLALGVAIFTLSPPSSFALAARPTHPVVDALYFCIVTLCTIGYGDITPNTALTKLFSIAFVLIGFGFVDILLSAMVSYVLDAQESFLLSSVKAKTNPRSRASYIVDVKKGRMRIRMKVGLALGVVVGCIGVGAVALRVLEHLGWLDAFYLSVMSVTTVGYGDRAFRSLTGRLFASGWLLVSTLAVARAFLYLAEARIDKRHRMMAKLVLSRDMTVSEFFAADIDHNGFVTKSEFVVYKLKEMGKVAEKDILQICNQFDRLDSGNCGKIHLSNLINKGHYS